MRLKILITVAWLLTAGGIPTFADIAPPDGHKRITLRLLVEPADELAEYRFFIRSGADVEEVTLTKGTQTSIGPLGGGARYSRGTFIAIPKASLIGMSDVPNDGGLSNLRQAVFDGKAAGAIDLVDHGFTKEVRDADAGAWKDPVYRIEKDASKGLKAVWVSGGAAESKTNGSSGSTYYSSDPKNSIFWASVVGASLLTFAAILFGAWMVRRSTAKSRSV